MSNLPVLCNACRKPSPACVCPRRPGSMAYAFWPGPQAHVPAQYQTPRRPNPQYSLPAQSTPHAHAPISFHPSFPSHIYHDPRLQAHPLAMSSSMPPPFQNHSMMSQSGHPPTFLQATPAHQSIQTPSEVRQPLSPVQESPAPANGRKRKRSDGAKATSKRTRRTQTRPRLNDENVDSSSVPGVGPSSHTSQVPATHPKPIADYSPISKPRKTSESKQIATDVWYFMRPLEARERPTGPLHDSPPSRSKPKSPFVGCRLCPSSELWSVWANTNGMADTIRSHLSTKHGNEWRKIVVLEKLKGHDKISGSSGNVDGMTRELFTLDGFLEKLARWIAVDDQSLNVVEVPEFRDLLLYLNADLQDGDIPHRTKITRVIFESYHREWKKLLAELQAAEGRISVTSDLWSDTLLRSFMAVTAHFVSKDKAGYLRICNRLIAFRHVSGQHSGARLAKHFFDILKELGIIHKVGMITLDNASNCASMMEELEDLFRERGIQFNFEENRIRCFPHVVNIAVKAALKELSKSAPELTDEDDVMPTWELNECDFAYADALESDVIGKARSLVSACRASGQRREDLQATITEGNDSKSFPDEKQLRNVELLRDMDVRWSATYLMIDRVLELYPAIDILLNKVKYKDIHKCLLDDVELQVLRDIAEFLKVPHAVQTTLCGEKTSTLSAVLPTYEDLLEMLRAYKVICPQLRRAISVCISKIEEYVNKSRKTRIYALAMIINPITKLHWIEEHWSQDEQKEAKEWMLKSMFEYKKAHRISSNIRQLSKSSSITSSSTSAQSQARGLAYIRSLKANLQRSASQVQAGLNPSVRSSQTPTSSTNNDTMALGATPNVESEEDAAQADERDRLAVADELQRYLAEGILDESEYHDFSLERYWQERRHQFPIIYHVALDVLPVQASSVACERVFSSSKETITMRRNKLSPELMEILQFLKYAHRQDRLNLMDGLISSEQELLDAEKSSVSPEVVRDLLAKGQVNELVLLLNNESL